jgi:hypothetical protein
MSASAAPAINPTGRVPAEYTGRARLLRDRVAEAHTHWVAAATALLAPLQPRDGFVPQYTQETLRITAARWKSSLPEWGRLRIASKLRNRTHLQVVETRLAPFRIVMQDWDATELSVAITLTVIDLRLPTFRSPPEPGTPGSLGREYSENVQVLGAVGLHALGRRFERGADRTDGAVLRDLFAIASAWPTAIRSPEFEIPIAGRGKWVGAVKIHAGKPALAVRTFIRE